MTTNAEQHPWPLFDNSLFEMKIRAPIRELQERAEAEKRGVRFEFRKSGNVNAFALEHGLQDCDLQLLEQWAALYDRLAREVWSIHGRVVTPAFVRMIFERLILPLLAGREAAIGAEFRLKTVRTNTTESVSIPTLRRLQTNVRNLREKLWERYEIEARTLAIQSAVSRMPADNGGPPEGVPLLPTESINQIRARTVAKVIRELDILKPLILGPADYLDLRPKFGDFITFQITDNHPALKDKLIHIQDHSRRHYRFAQEIAAAYHGRKLATVQTDWKRFKPPEFRSSSGGKKRRSR